MHFLFFFSSASLIVSQIYRHFVIIIHSGPLSGPFLLARPTHSRNYGRFLRTPDMAANPVLIMLNSWLSVRACISGNKNGRSSETACPKTILHDVACVAALQFVSQVVETGACGRPSVRAQPHTYACGHRWSQNVGKMGNNSKWCSFLENYAMYFYRPPFGPTFGSGLAGVEICHGNTTLLNYTLSPGDNTRCSILWHCYFLCSVNPCWKDNGTTNFAPIIARK